MLDTGDANHRTPADEYRDCRRDEDAGGQRDRDGRSTTYDSGRGVSFVYCNRTASHAIKLVIPVTASTGRANYFVVPFAARASNASSR